MSNSINFDVLNNAAASLFVTKPTYQGQIFRLLCQYHGANTNELVVEVANVLLKILQEEFIASTERSYYKALVIDATTNVRAVDVQPQVQSWLSSLYSHTLNK